MPAKLKTFTPNMFDRHPAMDRRRADPAGGWAVLRFDGACEGNGTPGARAGWAFHLTDHAGRELASGSGPVRAAGPTNNIAEWEGLTHGRDRVAAHADRPPGLLIEGDSQLVVFVLTGRWKSKAEHLTAYRDAARDTLESLGVPWAARWIPRDENAFCDELAGQHV